MFKVLLPFLFIMNAFAVDLEIRTNYDGASVYELKDEVKTLLGKTPLKLAKFDNVDGRLLVVEKKGYVPIYFPVSKKLNDFVITKIKLMKISEWESDDVKVQIAQKAEEVVDDVFMAQLLLDQRKISEATVKIDQLKANYPDNISVLIIYANLLMMQGKVREARNYYESLLEKIPDNRKIIKEVVSKIVNDLKRKS